MDQKVRRAIKLRRVLRLISNIFTIAGIILVITVASKIEDNPVSRTLFVVGTIIFIIGGLINAYLEWAMYPKTCNSLGGIPKNRQPRVLVYKGDETCEVLDRSLKKLISRNYNEEANELLNKIEAACEVFPDRKLDREVLKIIERYVKLTKI